MAKPIWFSNFLWSTLCVYNKMNVFPLNWIIFCTKLYKLIFSKLLPALLFCSLWIPIIFCILILRVFFNSFRRFFLQFSSLCWIIFINFIYISLYISFKNHLFLNHSPKIIDYTIVMIFSALGTAINIISSFYNFHIIYIYLSVRYELYTKSNFSNKS